MRVGQKSFKSQNGVTILKHFWHGKIFSTPLRRLASSAVLPASPAAADAAEPKHSAVLCSAAICANFHQLERSYRRCHSTPSSDEGCVDEDSTGLYADLSGAV